MTKISTGYFRRGLVTTHILRWWKTGKENGYFIENKSVYKKKDVYNKTQLIFSIFYISKTNHIIKILLEATIALIVIKPNEGGQSIIIIS